MAAEAAQIFDDRRADFAGAENADGEVAQLAALKTRKGVVVDLCAPQGGLILAQAKKHEHDGVICHAVRRVVGVAHLEAELLCGGEVDVVCADGARGDVFYAALPDGGEQGAVKTCAAEYCDALGPVYRIDVFERQVILCFGELHAALFGDEGKVFLFVPADFISGNFHFHIPLFGNAQAGYNVCFCALKCLHHSALVRIFVC